MNLPLSTRRIRSGFTLIELLFVIAIIAVLSTMALGVMRKAQDDAKEAATLSRISQIEAILQIELEDYEVRRLPVAISTLFNSSLNNPLYNDNNSDGYPDNMGVLVRNLKRRVLQDIINAEMLRPLLAVDGANNPIRDADGNLTFTFNDDMGKFPTERRAGTGLVGFAAWLDNYHPGLRAMLSNVPSSRVGAWANFRSTLDTSDSTATNYYEKFNLPGEYLYQMLVSMDFDGAPAIEVLGNQAIGNTDDDAFPEVVDAWGQPLQLRIWQVSAVEVAAGPGQPKPITSGETDIWEDKTPVIDPTFPEIDFDFKNADGIPQGYSVIDPTIPRDTTKLRFEVISSRLPY